MTLLFAVNNGISISKVISRLFIQYIYKKTSLRNKDYYLCSRFRGDAYYVRKAPLVHIIFH